MLYDVYAKLPSTSSAFRLTTGLSKIILSTFAFASDLHRSQPMLNSALCLPSPISSSLSLHAPCTNAGNSTPSTFPRSFASGRSHCWSDASITKPSRSAALIDAVL